MAIFQSVLGFAAYCIGLGLLFWSKRKRQNPITPFFGTLLILSSLCLALMKGCSMHELLIYLSIPLLILIPAPTRWRKTETQDGKGRRT